MIENAIVSLIISVIAGYGGFLYGCAVTRRTWSYKVEDLLTRHITTTKYLHTKYLQEKVRTLQSGMQSAGTQLIALQARIDELEQAKTDQQQGNEP